MLLPSRALPIPPPHRDVGPARVRTRTPRVLVVGAYERDNFGDLLFLLVTERYLAEAEVVAAAPFAADMTALLDRRIHAYGPLLQREAFDVIWTAGGQVGALDVERAYRMSAPPAAYRGFRRRSRRGRERILRRAVGDAPVVSPYIPSTAGCARNAGAVTVLNSAGLSGIAALAPERRDALVALLRSRTHIAVRDRASSRFLTGLGIDHRLVPDAVHAVAILWPGERDPGSDVAIFQASSAILARLGHANVAAALAASRRLKGLKLRLLLAGTATGHDAVADYERVVAGVRRAAPGTDIEILEARRPLELVAQLRGARVVIGSSLHVRIVAGAYGVARVTLSRSKPTRYARTWDARMPFDVPLTRLDPAIGAALARAERPGAAAASAALARLAHENLADLAGRALAGPATARDT